MASGDGFGAGLALVGGLEAGAAAQRVALRCRPRALAGNAALPAAGAGVKRLILTDGSYQTATEWKTVGERVEYYSAERSEWEEVPAALVDWKATEEWNAEASKSQEETLKQESGEEIAARKEAELNTPQVAPELAPELRLPRRRRGVSAGRGGGQAGAAEAGRGTSRWRTTTTGRTC